MSKYKVRVNLCVDVEVELDDSHFTPEMLKEWEDHMYSGVSTKEDHAEHIAQFYVRNGCELYGIDGYADTKLEVRELDEDCETEIKAEGEQR